MTYSSTLTSKGQITIPKEIRVRLGLHEGEKVDFISEGGEIIIRPAKTTEDPFAKYVGILGGFPGGVEEINAWVRDMRDDNE